MNLVEVAPVRLAAWEDGPRGRVVVVRPRPRPGPDAWRRWGFYLLGARRIRLDDVGSAAWRLMDGRHTVGDLADRLRALFGGRVEPVEERLGRLVRILKREGLVGYGGYDPVPRVEPALMATGNR